MASAATAAVPVPPPQPAAHQAGPAPFAGTVGDGDGVAITMPRGLPGFADIARFRLEPLPGVDRFLRLRAEDAGGPAFIVLRQDPGDPLVGLEETTAASVAAGLDSADLAVLFVVTAAREEGRLRLYANRRAPLLVDRGRRLGVQVVLPRPDYAVREPLAP